MEQTIQIAENVYHAYVFHADFISIEIQHLMKIIFQKLFIFYV